MKTKLIAYLAVASLSGCAMQPQRPSMIYPTIDTAVKPSGREYIVDVTECNNYVQSMSVGNGAINGAVGGAAVGAALGAVLAAAMGVNPGYGAMWGAASGGTSGGVQGAVATNAGRHAVVARCMAGRGWSVLAQ
jgi:hypothetical protein